MLDLDAIWIPIECPKCKFQDEIQLINVKNENQIYCNNCKVTIQLKDENASAHTAAETMNQLNQSLENILRKFGKQ